MKFVSRRDLGRRTHGPSTPSPAARSRPAPPTHTFPDACPSHPPPARSESPPAAQSHPLRQAIQHGAERLDVHRTEHPDRSALEADLDATDTCGRRARRAWRGSRHRQKRRARQASPADSMQVYPSPQEVRVDAVRQCQGRYRHSGLFAQLDQGLLGGLAVCAAAVRRGLQN